MRAALVLLAGVGVRAGMCPGSVHMKGYGKVEVTNSGWYQSTFGSKTEIIGTGSKRRIQVHLNDRAYLADSCSGDAYLNTRYQALKLLGKKLTYTTLLNNTGCGCNVAMYLVSMAQNTEISSCNDYYCDANKVCKIACTEVDIQEANTRAWRSTLHSHDDRSGVTGGYGGGDGFAGPRDFLDWQYGPEGKCIDTRFPFEVTTIFPVDATGQLSNMEVTLTQKGKDCPLKATVGDYYGMPEVTESLAKGMTPVVSYWVSEEMLWMDGTGLDGKGPCKKDAGRCGETVQFYNFKVEDLPGGLPEGLPLAAGSKKGLCAGKGKDCRISQCCELPGMQRYEKNPWWAECKETCMPGSVMLNEDTPWSCKKFGERTADNRTTELLTVLLPVEDAPPNGTKVTLVYDGEEVVATVDEQEKSEKVKATLAAMMQGRAAGNHSLRSGSVDGALQNKTTTPVPELHA